MDAKRTLNLTQHPATADQIAAGVVDFEQHAERLRELLTLTSPSEVNVKADRIIALGAERARDQGAQRIMLGGHPALMASLEAAFLRRGFDVVYAFSRRRSVEETLPDGTVKKTSVFEHEGFVERRATWAARTADPERVGNVAADIQRLRRGVEDGLSVHLVELGGGDAGDPGFEVRVGEAGHPHTITRGIEWDVGGFVAVYGDAEELEIRKICALLEVAPGKIPGDVEEPHVAPEV